MLDWHNDPEALCVAGYAPDADEPLPEAVASIVPDWLMDLKDTSGHLYACGYAGHCTYASVEN